MSRKSNKVFMIFSALCILFVVDAHAGSPLGILTNFFPYNSFLCQHFALYPDIFLNKKS